MGVNIETDTAVPDLLAWLSPAFDGDGFTAGDPQSGEPATQLSARWCNAVQFHINYAIALGDITPVYTGDDPNTANWEQLGQSIAAQDRDYYPRAGGAQTTYRTHTTTNGNDSKVWEKTAVVFAAAQNTVQTFCGIEDIPDESQFWVTFTGECVQTDSLTTYSNIVLRCSCRKSGGTVTVQKTTTVDSDGALGVTWSVVNDSGKPSLRASLPAAALKTFNISGHGFAHNVKRF